MVHDVSLIILYDRDHKLLLQHRTLDCATMPGYWAFFGGGIEAGETPIDALRREALEELEHQVASPRLLSVRGFRERRLSGRLHIFIEDFPGDKSKLRLHEGQGWGWFSPAQTRGLKMRDRDRRIISEISRHLDSVARKAHSPLRRSALRAKASPPAR